MKFTSADPTDAADLGRATNAGGTDVETLETDANVGLGLELVDTMEGVFTELRRSIEAENAQEPFR